MEQPPPRKLDGIATEILQGILSFMFMALVGWIAFLIGRASTRDGA
jgi:hypothetical protein